MLLPCYQKGLGSNIFTNTNPARPVFLGCKIYIPAMRYQSPPLRKKSHTTGREKKQQRRDNFLLCSLGKSINLRTPVDNKSLITPAPPENVQTNSYPRGRISLRASKTYITALPQASSLVGQIRKTSVTLIMSIII